MLFCIYQHTIQLRCLKQVPQIESQTYLCVWKKVSFKTRDGQVGLEQSSAKAVFNPYEFLLNESCRNLVVQYFLLCGTVDEITL
jgi:hypothetical protein